MGRKSRLKKEKEHAIRQNTEYSSPSDTRTESFMSKKIFFIILILLFSLGVTLRINNQAGISMRSPDEGIYTNQAKTIAQHGSDGMKYLIRTYNANKELWIYPPPTRIGYLLPLAILMRVSNDMTEEAGSHLACLFSIISLLLLIVLGFRFFNRWITLYALTFMCISPMALAISRRSWQDAMLGCFGLFLIYLCCEITRAPRKLFLYIIFIIIGSYSILIKESGLLIYGLCTIWLLWTLVFKEKSLLKGSLLASFSIIGLFMSVAYLAYSIGGMRMLLEVWGHVKEAMPTNAYAIQYQTGPWYYLLQGFWIISPVNAILCLVGTVRLCLFNKQDRENVLAFSKNKDVLSGIIFFMLAFTTITMVMPYVQNLRYVSVLFAPFYLVSGFGLWSIAACIKTKVNKFSFSIVTVIVIIVSIAVAMNDYRSFKKIFVKRGLLDLSIGLLKESTQ